FPQSESGAPCRQTSAGRQDSWSTAEATSFATRDRFLSFGVMRSLTSSLRFKRRSGFPNDVRHTPPYALQRRWFLLLLTFLLVFAAEVPLEDLSTKISPANAKGARKPQP